jgi:ribosomal protein S7
LGVRNRRRGGAVVKVPNLLKQHQSWSLVRRWFTRGVSQRVNRSWVDRVLHEGTDPVRTSRAREDFIRAALMNRALL